MISNLNFFKGDSSNLPSTDSRQPYSFYLTEDTNNFYYTNQYKTLIRMAADPSETIKEIHTLYNSDSDILPTEYPLPETSSWTENFPPYTVGDSLYFVDCIVYMDDSYSFSEVQSLITFEEIDEICTYKGEDVE